MCFIAIRLIFLFYWIYDLWLNKVYNKITYAKTIKLFVILKIWNQMWYEKLHKWMKTKYRNVPNTYELSSNVGTYKKCVFFRKLINDILKAVAIGISAENWVPIWPLKLRQVVLLLRLQVPIQWVQCWPSALQLRTNQYYAIEFDPKQLDPRLLVLWLLEILILLHITVLSNSIRHQTLKHMQWSAESVKC